MVQPEDIFVYPDYIHEGNPHTGDDLGLIKLNHDSEYFKKILKNCSILTAVKFDINHFEDTRPL